VSVLLRDVARLAVLAAPPLAEVAAAIILLAKTIDVTVTMIVETVATALEVPMTGKYSDTWRNDEAHLVQGS